jgi:soluble lytic murein transglycosylase
MVGELVFLRLWDEAFYWANRVANRWKDVALADLAYLASDFKRSMLYADRLRPVDDKRLFSLDSDYDEEERTLLGMLYPSAFNDAICRESVEAGVNPLWLQAIIWQESRFDPSARSGASARGLMQFIPETAAMMAAELGMGELELDALYEPSLNIRLGANYWSRLMEELDHPALALAAYNGGIENVRRWEAKSGSDDMDLFVSDIGFVQTKDYVMKVFALYATYAHLR